MGGLRRGASDAVDVLRRPLDCFALRRAGREGRLDLLVELFEVERFVDVRIRTVQRTCHLVQILADPGEHHDARVGERDVLSDLAADFPAAHPRHHHVEDHEVGQALARKLPRFVSIGRFDHFELRCFD